MSPSGVRSKVGTKTVEGKEHGRNLFASKLWNFSVAAHKGSISAEHAGDIGQCPLEVLDTCEDALIT